MSENLLIQIFKKNLKLKLSEINALKKNKNIFFNIHKNWDSLTHVVLLNDIQKRFKIKIDEKNIKYFESYSLVKKFLKLKKKL